MLVQHMGEVPDSLPVTDETRERLREQANQLPAADRVRLIDLLRVAVDDMRQGGDPRLPLELALVKVTRPAADLSRESLSFRLERLEGGHVSAPRAESSAPQGESRKAGSSSEQGSVTELPAAPPSPWLWPPHPTSSSSSCRRPGGERSCRPSKSARSRSARRSPRHIRSA
jgi:DNA polymerase-3 subunit gamma/tau